MNYMEAEQVFESIHYSEADQEYLHRKSRAGSKVIIDNSIKAIQLTGKNMEKCEEQEPTDYHWLLIAEKIKIIDVLVIKLGG